jgi:hypothetical protein
VTLYGALHGFYVVIIWIVFENTFYFDYVFVSFITVAYFCLFFSKYSLSRVLKLESKNKKKIKFVRAIKYLEQTEMLQSQTKISINGKYFYKSGSENHSMRSVLFCKMNSNAIKESYYSRNSANSNKRYLGKSQVPPKKLPKLGDSAAGVKITETENEFVPVLEIRQRSNSLSNLDDSNFDEITPIALKDTNAHAERKQLKEGKFNCSISDSSESGH